MAGLKELRIRISSISSTQKIASAMKMVAAARLKRAQDMLQKSQAYHQQLLGVVWRLLEEMRLEMMNGNIVYFLPQLMQPKDVTSAKVYQLVIFSSDKGLCGSYNSNVLKESIRRINELLSQGKQVKVLSLGKKAGEALKRRCQGVEIEIVDGFAAKGADYQEVVDLVNRLVASYNVDFDICEVIYTSFHSAISRDVKVDQFLPLQVGKPKDDVDITVNNAAYDYERGKQKVLWDMLPMVAVDELFQKLLNSQTSEHGARMTSMDNATRNAGDMINKLTLKYNRLRQSAITTELIEIISGAEAL